MNDLYGELGFSEIVDDLDVLRTAIRNQTNPYVKRAAKFVLLNESRKTVYDRHRRVLDEIGRLRSNLNLLHTEAWLETDSAEFSRFADDSSTRRILTEVDRLSQEPAAMPVVERPAGSIWPLILLGLYVVAMAFGTLFELVWQ